MSTRQSIPPSAETVCSLTGFVTKPDAWTFGKRITMVHAVAYRSDGFKSNYEQHRVEYLLVEIEGQKPNTRRYSGKNVVLIQREMEALRPWLSATRPAPSSGSL